jgi:hypothetical protein
VIVVRKNNTQRHFTHCSKISAIVPAVLHKWSKLSTDG